MAASVIPLLPEMRRSLASSQQTQQQRRRAAAATKAAAARWAADAETEDSSLSWWSASISEVQALERLIDRKLNKTSQLVLDRPGEPEDTMGVDELLGSDKSDVILALRSADVPPSPAVEANDISALREEFGRLAAQVRIQEGRFGSRSSMLETDVVELRKMIDDMRDQTEGHLREQRAGKAVEPQQEQSRRGRFQNELDEVRERCTALGRIVEDILRGQSRTVDSRSVQSPRQSHETEVSRIFGPEAQQIVSKVAEDAATTIARSIAQETARSVAEETASTIVDVAGAVQNEVAQLRQTQGEMLKEMAVFRRLPHASAYDDIASDVAQLRQAQGEMLKDMAAFRSRPHASVQDDVVKDMRAIFADAFNKLEMSCSAAHDAVVQQREEFRTKHDDLSARITMSEQNFIGLKSRFEGFPFQDQWQSPKQHIKQADKTDSPGALPQEFVELRSDLDVALRGLREMREESLLSRQQDFDFVCGEVEKSLRKFQEETESMLTVDTPRGRVALTSLPGELEGLRQELERVVRELREESENVAQNALIAVENSRLEQFLPSSLQSFREEIDAAVCEIRRDVGQVETTCLEKILPSSLEMFRKEIETAVSGLRESISTITERLQSQHLQLQQTTPRMSADIDAIRAELAALQDSRDIDMLKSELRGLLDSRGFAELQKDLSYNLGFAELKKDVQDLQEDRFVIQSALDEGIVCIAKTLGDLHAELSDVREVSDNVEKLHSVLENSVANLDAARTAAQTAVQVKVKTATDGNAEFDRAQAKLFMQMAQKLGDAFALGLGDDTFRSEAVDNCRLNLSRLGAVVNGLLERQTRGPTGDSECDPAQLSASLDNLRVQCQELARSVQVPSDLQLQVSELSTRMDEIVEGGLEETQKITLSHLESSRTALETMMALLNKQQRADDTTTDVLDKSLPLRPNDVPALTIEGAAPNHLQLEVASSLQLPSNRAGVEELWAALGGRALAEQVQELRQGQVSSARWEELREQHADLSKMVAMMQDMHCHNVRALWEDLRAVCKELANVSETSESVSAQAAAAQALGVGAAASQAVTLWEELGTPRRAELVGMIGEVRSLRNEVEILRAVKEVEAKRPEPNNCEPSSDFQLLMEEAVTLTTPSENASLNSEPGRLGLRGRRLSPHTVDTLEEPSSASTGPDSGRRRPSWRQQQSSQPDSGRRRPSWRLPQSTQTPQEQSEDSQ